VTTGHSSQLASTRRRQGAKVAAVTSESLKVLIVHLGFDSYLAGFLYSAQRKRRNGAMQMAQRRWRNGENNRLVLGLG